MDCFLLGVDGNDGSEPNRVRCNKVSAQCGADVVYIDVVLQAKSLTGRLEIQKVSSHHYPNFDFLSLSLCHPRAASRQRLHDAPLAVCYRPSIGLFNDFPWPTANYSLRCYQTRERERERRTVSTTPKLVATGIKALKQSRHILIRSKLLMGRFRL